MDKIGWDGGNAGEPCCHDQCTRCIVASVPLPPLNTLSSMLPCHGHSCLVGLIAMRWSLLSCRPCRRSLSLRCVDLAAIVLATTTSCRPFSMSWYFCQVNLAAIVHSTTAACHSCRQVIAIVLRRSCRHFPCNDSIPSSPLNGQICYVNIAPIIHPTSARHDIVFTLRRSWHQYPCNHSTVMHQVILFTLRRSCRHRPCCRANKASRRP